MFGDDRRNSEPHHTRGSEAGWVDKPHLSWEAAPFRISGSKDCESGAPTFSALYARPWTNGRGTWANEIAEPVDGGIFERGHVEIDLCARSAIDKHAAKIAQQVCQVVEHPAIRYAPPERACAPVADDL